jgi:hypothetical protein
MRDQQHGAVRFGEQWIWPQDVRQDAQLAEQIYHFKHAPREVELDELTTD